jgi:hypothetical protein
VDGLKRDGCHRNDAKHRDREEKCAELGVKVLDAEEGNAASGSKEREGEREPLHYDADGLFDSGRAYEGMGFCEMSGFRGDLDI